MEKVAYTTNEPEDLHDTKPSEATVDARWLREVALEAGAADVGFVSVSRPEVAGDLEDLRRAFPAARSLVSFVCTMNPDAIRSPARSIANVEFHHTGEHVNAIGRRIIDALRGRGHRGINPAMGFPMEMHRFPGKIWVISHKRVAEAAGLGKMGLHRNVIHPKLGNFILLGTIVTDATISEESRPIDYNPCLECKLCVAACPVGAIKPDGAFDFSACYTHNYREFMGGFTDWVEEVADSRSAKDYRSRVTDAESVSMWQSLSFGANYKAAYCMGVCPAGEDVIAPFRLDRAAYKKEVLEPLRREKEAVYVVAGTDAEAHVGKRFPHKQIRHVGNSLRPATIEGFLNGVKLTFQPGASKSLGLDATFHFRFSGEDEREATIRIKGGQIVVEEGCAGEADLTVRADSRAWLDLLAKNRGPLGLVLTGKLRVRGPLSLLKKFQRCFPG